MPFIVYLKRYPEGEYFTGDSVIKEHYAHTDFPSALSMPTICFTPF
jgi:hypothetical protein